MRARLKVSRQGIELIKGFEGLRQTAVRLPDGRWSLGYGHTFSAREGARVTEDDAEALLRFDLLPIVDALNSLIETDLNQAQFDALVSFCFNIGIDNFKASKVLKRLNAGLLSEAAQAMDAWRSAEFNGQVYVLEPLIRRRAAEKALFLGETVEAAPPPEPAEASLPSDEQANLEAASLEQASPEQASLEQARIEQEKLAQEETARAEQARLESERLESERLEAERLEAERLENERLEAERLENAHKAQEAAARLEAERAAEQEAELAAQQDAASAEPTPESVMPVVEETASPTPVPPQPPTDAAEPESEDEAAERARKAEAAAALMRFYSPYAAPLNRFALMRQNGLQPLSPAAPEPVEVEAAVVAASGSEPSEPQAEPQFKSQAEIAPAEATEAHVASEPEIESQTESATPPVQDRGQPTLRSVANMPPPVVTALHTPSPSQAAPSATDLFQGRSLNWREQLQRPLPEDYQPPSRQFEQAFEAEATAEDASQTEVPSGTHLAQSLLQAAQLDAPAEDEDWTLASGRVAVSHEDAHPESTNWWSKIVSTFWWIIISTVGMACLGVAAGAYYKSRDMSVIRNGAFGDYMWWSFGMAILGMLCVLVSVWLIMRRLGGLKD